MAMIDKTVRIGQVAANPEFGHGAYSRYRAYSVYCRIRFDGQRLSIVGVGGPLPNGNAMGSSGQCLDEVAKVTTLAPGWTEAARSRFLEVWGRWHLNDLRPECEHQRALGWHTRRIDPSKPANTYGRHFEGQRQDSWNLWGWIYPTEHPEGLLTAPCPECGYKYGSAWLTETVPDEVIEFLAGLPDADITPAWV